MCTDVRASDSISNHSCLTTRSTEAEGAGAGAAAALVAATALGGSLTPEVDEVPTAALAGAGAGALASDGFGA